MADKTASLFALAARLGARASGASAEVVRSLGEFGEALGIAFQLADDLLDLAKPGHPDLRAGVRTVPVLLAACDPLAHGPIRDPDERAACDPLAHGPIRDPDERAAFAGLLLHSPAAEATRAEIVRYADHARQALRSLPPVPAAEALAGLCRQVVPHPRARAVMADG